MSVKFFVLSLVHLLLLLLVRDVVLQIIPILYLNNPSNPQMLSRSNVVGH